MLALTSHWRSWSVGLLALGAGMIAAFAVRFHVKEHIQALEAQSRLPMVSRVVAAYDLAAGTRLDDGYVAVREIPAQWAASGTLNATEFNRLSGGILAVSLKRGDPLQRAHLSAHPDNTPLSAQLASGRRAITMPVDEVNGLAGMLEPGDLIDFYVSFTYHRQRVTTPLLQGVKVLATGRRAQENEPQNSAYSTVTLEVAPEEAVKLVAARQNGLVTAVLRHRNDDQPTLTAVQGDLAALLGFGRYSKVPARQIEIVYGDRSHSSVDRYAAQRDAIDSDNGIFQAQFPATLTSLPPPQASVVSR